MMTHFDVFSEISLPFVSIAESLTYLEGTRAKFNVRHLSYWFVGSSVYAPERLMWLSTYDRDYTTLYMRDFSPSGDPAFSVCFGQALPLDWTDVRDQDETTRHIHEVAAHYGVGRQGISFPLHDPGFGQAMFSVNVECTDAEWLQARKTLVTVFHLFGHYFHLRIKDLISRSQPRLSSDLAPREKEVLAWAAEGKTAWETARLLGLSERAVRLYTENAMTKLKAATKTQAVAIAVKDGIIS